MLNTVDIWVCDVYLLPRSEFIPEKQHTSFACENGTLCVCVGCRNCFSRVSGEAYIYADFWIAKTWFWGHSCQLHRHYHNLLCCLCCLFCCLTLLNNTTSISNITFLITFSHACHWKITMTAHKKNCDYHECIFLHIWIHNPYNHRSTILPGNCLLFNITNRMFIFW